MTIPHPSQPLSVLVVDDNLDGGESTALLLRLLGHRAWHARTGAEALAVAPSFNPDVALLDIGLPDMDGCELAPRLVAALPRRPVLVAVTGFPQQEERSRRAGFDHHFLKPLDPAVLATVLDPRAGSARPTA